MTLRKSLLKKALLTLLAAFPLALPSVVSRYQQASTLSGPPMKEVLERAKNAKAEVIQRARTLKEFHDKCADRLQEDPAFVCPSYHDLAAVEALMADGKTAQAAPHAAAGSSSAKAAVIGESDLMESDQSLLRRYLNAGSCPETLKKYIPGFYDLCRTMLGKTTTRSERRGVQEKVEAKNAAVRAVKSAREQRKLERLERNTKAK